jgi:hypothetical protein
VSEAASTVVGSVRTAGSTAMDLVQAAAEEAEKKRRRDMRRLRKKGERVEKNVEELLKVLTTVSEQPPQAVAAPSSSQSASALAVSLGKAEPAAKDTAPVSGRGLLTNSKAEPAAKDTAPVSGRGLVTNSRVSLSFDGFCSAVDGALRRTQAKCSTGDANSKGGLSPRHSAGDLYCRKLVAHWPAAAAAAATAPLWGAEPEPEVSAQAESESVGISLLPSTAASEQTESISDVRLLPSTADPAATATVARGLKVPI